MTLSTLTRRSLRFYWRTHLGVVLGVAVSAMVLIGALVVGDSVQGSLKEIAQARLGKIDLAIIPQDRYFRAQLAPEVARALDVPVAPMLLLHGIAVNEDGTARANQVQIIGVDDRFWELGSSSPPMPIAADEALINETLAQQLGAEPDDSILLRVEKPGVMPRDAPLATDEDAQAAMRVRVRGTVTDKGIGRFSLRANQFAPFNAFVPLAWLSERVELAGRVNTLLLDGDDRISLDAANAALAERWTLADSDLELESLTTANAFELSSGRIFLDPPIVDRLLQTTRPDLQALTYFVNALRHGDRATPYSMVTALGPVPDTPRPAAGLYGGVVPVDMRDDEILVNAWLAEDIHAGVGDDLELTYYVVGRMRRLEERTSRFRIRDILPMQGPAADPQWMPDFPGLANAEDCRNWDPSLPIDLDRIRDKDEAYWDRYRGTPKAFVTLAAGQRLWGNRFGDLTALRYDATEWTNEELTSAIKTSLSPEQLGLFFQPVRERAQAASTQALDFGQLFLGLSFFLIAAALLLTGLLFAFGMEQRSEELGTLLAVGWTPAMVRRYFLTEGGVLALLGGMLGIAGAFLYTRAVLYALRTVWQGAVAGTAIRFHAAPQTLAFGGILSILVGLLVIGLGVRRYTGRPARQLLARLPDTRAAQSVRRNVSFWIGVTAVFVAVLMVTFASRGQSQTGAGVFFASGALLLIGSIALVRALFVNMSRWAGDGRPSLYSMGVRNTIRRRGRSVAVVAILACSTFLIVSVGANRQDPTADHRERDSGTGGFALFGQATLPIFHDPNTVKGREAIGIDRIDLEGVAFVPLRVHEGDDASCLNLNRSQMPQLLGVDPQQLASRDAFQFVRLFGETPVEAPWSLLQRPLEDGVVPAVGDQATIVWALGKSVGDSLQYTDERGRTFTVRLVGMLANSVLQGNLLISEDDFIRHFPSESGYRVFLIDAPFERVEEISQQLTRTLQDIGLELTPAATRLAMFHVVENTYLSIFQMLGGLGLLIGSIGLGILVLRNVLERRSELALLRAVGFERNSLGWLLLYEHWGLLGLGLTCGVLAAFVAVLPALLAPGAEVPYTSLGLLLLFVTGSGLLWTWLAAQLALRGPLLNALRNE